MKNNLKALLGKVLRAEEMQYVPNSFELIGSNGKIIALVEIPNEIKDRKTIIAETIMKMNKNVKSVLEKSSARKGEFRTREYEVIAGSSETEVLHKEHGYWLKLDPQKVYFSPREGTERQRVAKEAKWGENVLVMFSGISSFPIAIASEQPDVGRIIAIEINLEAHKYALENVRINRLSHKIVPINGDVKVILPKLDMHFDRILMPLPLEAYNFLELAILYLNKDGVIHFYFIGKEPNVFSETEELIKRRIEQLGKNIKALNKKRVLQYSPRAWKCVMDIYLS